jgi:GATA-binding protein
VSVYSSQPPTPGSISGPPSSYSSPAIATFPIPRSSQSPPIDAGPQGPIRLPNAPLSDIASLQQQAPRKSATAPGYFSQPPVSYQGQEALRRGSITVLCEQQRRVQFASPQMQAQSLAPMSGLTSEAPVQQSPQITQMQLSSPQMMTSSPVPAAAEPLSS